MMGNFAKVLLGIFLITLTALSGIGTVMAGADTAEAEKYHADVITEIECSNYNDTVMASCAAQAANNGYELTIDPIRYDEAGNIQTAEVILKYKYEIPLFQISKQKEIRGFAR